MFNKITEQSSLHDDLDKKSVEELLIEMNEEDQKVPLAVKAAIPQITKLVEEIVPRMKKGGNHIIYPILFQLVQFVLIPYLCLYHQMIIF